MLVGLEMILNKAERRQVRARLERTGKDIVELSPHQIENFAGNAIELHNRHGEKLLVLSKRAIQALTKEQYARLTRYVRLVRLELPTIELGGGSARCMIATIHLYLAVVATLCECSRPTFSLQNTVNFLKAVLARTQRRAHHRLFTCLNAWHQTRIKPIASLLIAAGTESHSGRGVFLAGQVNELSYVLRRCVVTR